MQQIVNEIIEALNQYADPKRIEFAKTSYPTAMKVIGVVNAKLKTVLKALQTNTKNYKSAEVIQLAKMMVDTNIMECQQLAFEFLDKNKKALAALQESDIDDMQRNMDNWVSVDYFGALIVGYAWRENIITTQKIKDYNKSNDFWIRRIALVATVSLNQKARGGNGDAKRTLEICQLAVNDHTNMINKALSWALRELAKREKAPVVEFIQKHEKQLHKRVLREVKNKLQFGTKH